MTYEAIKELVTLGLTLIRAMLVNCKFRCIGTLITG